VESNGCDDYRQATQESSQDCTGCGKGEGGDEGQEEVEDGALVSLWFGGSGKQVGLLVCISTMWSHPVAHREYKILELLSVECRQRNWMNVNH
jgi:hypothetical protein